MKYRTYKELTLKIKFSIFKCSFSLMKYRTYKELTQVFSSIGNVAITLCLMKYRTYKELTHQL